MLVEFLKKYENKDIIYIPNPGNAGDSLIAYGTITLFKKIGLNYKIGEIKKNMIMKFYFMLEEETLLDYMTTARIF